MKNLNSMQIITLRSDVIISVVEAKLLSCIYNHDTGLKKQKYHKN